MQAWHDKDIGRGGQTAEGIILHYIGVERRVRRHFAFIFKAHPALVEQFDGITYIVEPFAFGISKGGIGKESHTRLMTHAASYGRSTFGNRSEEHTSELQSLKRI